MGLDMYLHAERYITFADWSPDERAVAALIAEQASLPLDLTNNGFNSVEVKVQVAYWRKANQIHRWFVNNVQNGVDDCGTYHVSIEELIELVDLCREVLNSDQREQDARDRLPPWDGFFFGSTNIDEWYWQDLEGTVEQLTKVIDWATQDATGHVSFTYHSSW